MEIFLNNSLNQKKESFKPVNKGVVGMYHCGPTVYDRSHIGNLRAYVFADLLRRLFEYSGYEVNQVINITDVGHLTSDADSGEDKVEKAVKETGKDASELTQMYTDYFMKDISALNIDVSKIQFPKATEHIDEQIELIQKLEDGGYTYKTSTGIYYDTSKFEDYGQLGNVKKIKEENQKDGRRIKENEEKKNTADFALWKFSGDEKRQQEWDSPWGVGFPGWHLECSAMSTKYLGQPFDIHTGGIDHLQIHHNNEIAQSQVLENKSQANYWLHHNHITLNGEKIAKSVGNTINLDDLVEKGIHPLSFRYWLLTSHYSTLTNYTDDAIEAADTAYKKILNRFANTEIGSPQRDYVEKILTFLNDDLETPQSVAEIWTLIKDDTVSEEDKLATILEVDKVLGLDIDNQRKNYNIEVPEEVQKLVTERDAARKEGEYEKADEMRKDIADLGYEIEDSENGTIIHKA